MVKVVISGVNLVEGGILTILQDCLQALTAINKEQGVEVIALVHDRRLINELADKEGVRVIEFPEIKSSWKKRVFFEYKECKKISDQLKPDIWISLHDITPNVNCRFQVVYCHNPSPFYKLDVKRFFYDTTFSLFCLFYKFLYGINIKKNAYVIIQQQWLREEFKKRYNVDSIVAHPIQKKGVYSASLDIKYLNIDFQKTVFFFPSIPRVFKNFEIICEAARILEMQDVNFEVVVTLDGTENKYAKEIYAKYRHLKSIRFIGIQKRDVIETLYSQVDCLVFPSKLETWGLPISEFKGTGKPILVANLPYAYENINDYPSAKFFSADDARELANYMRMLIQKRLVFDSTSKITPPDPFFNNWPDLIQFLLKEGQS